MTRYDKETTALHSYARWEKREHGKCSENGHLSYRVRKQYWVEIRCKLCTRMSVEQYEDSSLNPPRVEENAA